jgi:hypothetical protein
VLAWRGIELCREGDWQTGFYWLSLAADTTAEANSMPSLYFAFLGYGLARFQGEAKEGIRLCRHAVHLELYQPESYYYLARTHLLAGDRRSAFDVVERGLQIDATDAGLKELRSALGARRSPVLPFLPRRHRLNHWLGRLRHRLFGPRKPA